MGLFSSAGRVGRGLLAEEMQKVGHAVEEASKAHAEDEDIAADAPEEFLDPIMSHLMTDPVTLPSSKVSVAAAYFFLILFMFSHFYHRSLGL